MRGIAIPLLAVAAPLIAELPSAGGPSTTQPASSEAPLLERSARRGTTMDRAARRARRTAPAPTFLASRLRARRGGYQVHNGRAALDAATT
jgi:hypothetical protein